MLLNSSQPSGKEDHAQQLATSSLSESTDTPNRREFLRLSTEFLTASLAVEALTAPGIAHATEPTQHLQRLALTEPATWSVKNRTICINGDPFFPKGIYYTAHHGDQKEQRLKDLETIADLGLNMIHTPVDLNDRPLLDKAAKLGLHVAIEFNGEPSSILKKFSGHAAIAFLGTFDDVDQQSSSGKQRYNPEQVARRSAAIKKLAPNALTYISGGYPGRHKQYRGKSDLYAQQSYPIPVEPLSSVTTSYLGQVAKLDEKMNQGFISNLQSFGWDGTYRPPSPAELSNMTYQSLLLGTQGITYYTFFDSVTDMNKTPGLLAEMRTLTAEIQSLEPFLLTGTHSPLTTNRGEVFASSWLEKEKEQLLIIVANSYSNDTDVTIQLPRDIFTTGDYEQVLTGRPATLDLNGSTLTGEMKAAEVQSFLLKSRENPRAP